MMGTTPSGTLPFDIAYALFRFYCGISIAIGAGLSKVFHKIDEQGGTDWANLAFGVPDWFVKQVGDIGFSFPSPYLWAALATYGEFIGGLFIAFGFLTRFSAIQMAFQFFVVAFIWYKTPEPFAMYYQQLIFWTFVLISVAGAGRFSIDQRLLQRKGRTSKATAVAVTCLTLFAVQGMAQNTPQPMQRVSFTLTNPTLKQVEMDIRCFNYADRKRIGYGLTLGALHNTSDNKPVGTRIYLKKGKSWELFYVLGPNDDGKKINLNKTYEISQEQWLQVGYDEMNEKTEELKKIDENPDVETVAKQLGLEMITFRIAGTSLFGKQTHVRVQLPYLAERTNTGFSRKLSRFEAFKVSYPIGTKVYLCDGPYWNGPVPEKLVLTVDAEKANYLIRL